YTLKTSYYEPLDLNIVSLVHTNNLVEKILIIMSIQVILLIFYYCYMHHKALFISQSNSVDINKLILLLDQIKGQAQNLDHGIIEENEFKYLGSKIIEMESEINRLFKQKISLLETLYKVQIKNLETQFQPHFIFNTLENINYLITTNKSEASKYIILLTRLIRYSSDHFKDLVLVKEDIFQIERYLELLKLRFEDNLTYQIKISTKALKLEIPKLLIQPLIENSIKYGFKIQSKVNIVINMDVIDGYLLIEVIDNAGGMDINKILNLSTQKSLGINLVKKRVLMLYQDDGAVLFLN
ncbi:MAG: sensor histidine kinase, partial [Bacilli bacterium]